MKFNFFKKKSKNNEPKVNVLNKKVSYTRTKISFAGAALLGLTAVGGITGSIVYSAFHYKLSSDYSNSYLCRYELDTSRNDDPTVDPLNITDNTLQTMADNSANGFSQYLSSLGYTGSIKVTSEVYPDTNKAFIDAYIPKNEVLPGDDKKPGGG
jgi:hypothetical protein